MSNKSNVFWSALVAVASVFLGPVPSLIGAVFRVVSVGTTIYAFLESRRVKRNPAERTRQPELALKSTTAPRQRIYGEARVGGVLSYWVTHGAEFRQVSIVYLLADHEIDSVQDVLFDGKSIGALDGSGFTQAGSSWYKNNLSTYSEARAVVSQSMTITKTPVAKATVSLRVGTDPDNGGAIYQTLVEGVDFFHTIGSTTITFSAQWANVPAEQTMVTYQYNDGAPLARVRVKLGGAGQTVDSQLVTDSGGEWTSADVAEGVAYMIVTLTWDETKAAAGFPEVSAIVRGCRVYDPRTATTYWNPNWALCVADYLKYAFKATNAEIESASLIDSANISDQDVTVSGGTVKRYTCNGVLFSDRARGDNLEELLLAGAGGAPWSGGYWRVLCGAYRSPVSITLTDSDLAGTGVQIRSFLPRSEAFNLVRGTFYDARAVGGAKLYTETSYTPFSSSAYLAEDNNEEIAKTINFAMVTDYRVANRLAKQIMQRARQALKITATFKLRALPLQVGDVVTMSLSRYGISTKNFEIVDRGYIFPAGVELVLQETAPAVYDWDYTAVAFLDPAPNTLLPDPTNVDRPVLTAFSSPDTFSLLVDGTIVPYVRLTWPLRAVGSEYISARWKRSNESLYRTVTARPGETEMRIEPVSGGDVLQILGYAVNSIGARSQPWVIQEHFVDPGLPKFAGETPALSANLARGTTFEGGAGDWTAYTVGLSPVPPVVLEKYGTDSHVPGSPSNIILRVSSSAASGSGAFAANARSAPISVTPGARYVAFASVIGWDTDAFVAIAWFGAGDVLLGVTYGNTVAGVGWESPARRWNRREDYQMSSLFVNAPPSARSAWLMVVGGGVWPVTTNPFGARWVSILEPFLGAIPEGVTVLPPYDPGAGNMVGTALITAGAATQIARVENGPGGTFSNPTLQGLIVNLAQMTTEAAGAVEITVTCEVTGSGGASAANRITGGLSLTGKLAVVSREVFTVPANSTLKSTLTLSAIVDVAAGETITPTLQIFRSLFGFGVGNSTDRVTLVTSRLTLIKR